MTNENNRKPLEIWSCDPASIPPWTKEAEERLHKVLDQIFGKPVENDQEGE